MVKSMISSSAATVLDEEFDEGVGRYEGDLCNSQMPIINRFHFVHNRCPPETVHLGHTDLPGFDDIRPGVVIHVRALCVPVQERVEMAHPVVCSWLGDSPVNPELVSHKNRIDPAANQQMQAIEITRTAERTEQYSNIKMLRSP